jgi:hypothetical protein
VLVPANANTGDFAVIVGGGNPSPGLTTTPTFQTFSFSGNGAGTIGGQTGPFSCTFNGDDTVGTTQQSSGVFNGSCNTPCATVGITGTYTRTVAFWSAGATFTSGCLYGRSVAFTCVWVPTSAPTVVSYEMVCIIT